MAESKLSSPAPPRYATGKTAQNIAPAVWLAVAIVIGRAASPSRNEIKAETWIVPAYQVGVRSPGWGCGAWGEDTPQQLSRPAPDGVEIGSAPYEREEGCEHATPESAYQG